MSRAIFRRLASSRMPVAVVAISGSLLLTAPLSAQTPPAATPPAATPPAGTAPAAANAATATATTAAPPAVVRPPRESWTADRRNFAVGDLVTVLIDDYTISTAIKENIATDTRTRGLSVAVRLPTSSKNVGIDSRNNADQQQRGAARRENRFQNELSVRVVAITPNGLLQLKGKKNINVDKAMQDIEFTGFVRPQDISTTNVVESSRIADAQLGYLSPGPLGKPKQSIVGKLLGAFWP